MKNIGPTGVDVVAAAEAMRRSLVDDIAAEGERIRRSEDQIIGHGAAGRFTKGNRCSKGKRPPATPDLRQALRRAMTPRAARAIAKRLIRVARSAENDATAVAAAELILDVFRPLVEPRVIVNARE